MKATEQYFSVVLFIMLYKVFLTFETLDEILNDLPFFIRNISSVNAFKKALKTHLLRKAFPS